MDPELKRKGAAVLAALAGLLFFIALVIFFFGALIR